MILRLKNKMCVYQTKDVKYESEPVDEKPKHEDKESKESKEVKDDDPNAVGL